eukprot:7378211-Prymnesium_polylepis.1
MSHRRFPLGTCLGSVTFDGDDQRTAVEVGRGLSPGEFAPLEAADLSKARATTAPLPRSSRASHLYRTQY